MACPQDLGDCLIFQTGSAPSAHPDAGTMINSLLPNIYIAAGLIIFFMVIFGGFMIISNAGQPDKVKDGSKIITSAIIGLLLVFASYWIIQIIQVVTGIKILNSGL